MVIDVTKFFVRNRVRRARQADTQRRRASAPGEDQIIIGESTSGTKVTWPRPKIGVNTNALVLGKSGCGKSIMVSAALLKSILLDLRTKPAAQRTCNVVVDAKGDLGGYLLAGLAASGEASELLDKVFFLDPFTKGRGYPFNLRQLDSRTDKSVLALGLAELCGELSTGMGSQAHLSQGSRQVQILSTLFAAILSSPHPQASPLWALDALQRGRRGFADLAAITSCEKSKQFLMSKQHIPDSLLSSVLARLTTGFALTEHIEKQMSADTCVQMSETIRPGNTVVIDLGNPPNAMVSITRYYASLLVRLIINHALERPSPYSENGFGVNICIDESQIVIPAIAPIAQNLLETARSRGVSLTLMTQGTATIRKEAPTLLSSIMSNVEMILAGSLSAADAETLSRELAPSLGVEQSISKLRQDFVARATNLEPRFFNRIGTGERTVFRTADVPLEDWQQATIRCQAQLDAVKSRLAPALRQGPRPQLPDLPRSRPRPKKKKPKKTSKQHPPTLWG